MLAARIYFIPGLRKAAATETEEATMFLHTENHIKSHIMPSMQALIDSLEADGIAEDDTVRHENLVNGLDILS